MVFSQRKVYLFSLESDLAVLVFLWIPRSSLTLLFSSYRNLLARKQNARLDKQNDLGWKLFGKVPLRENAQKDSKKIQKVYETPKLRNMLCSTIYEPCKSDLSGGFEIGKLCVDLHAHFLKSESFIRKLMPLTFSIPCRFPHVPRGELASLCVMSLDRFFQY